MTENTNSPEKGTTARMLYTTEYSGELEEHQNKFGMEGGRSAARRREGQKKLEQSGELSVRIIGKANVPEYSRGGFVVLDRDEFFQKVNEHASSVEWSDEDFEGEYEQWVAERDG